MKIISRRARPHTITLYNFISTTSGIETYQRTVLQFVYLDTAYQQNSLQRGISTDDTAQLIIELRDVIITNGRSFKPYTEWKKLSVIDKANYFTFNVKKDFFIDGEATETLPDTTKAEMIEYYQCLSVTSVANPASSYNVPIILEITAK